MSAGGNAGADVHAIPTDWASRPLGELATVGAGGTPSREVQAYWSGSIPWITTSQIDFNRINAAEQFITEEGLRNSSAKLLPPGTLLLALYGQGKTRGKVGILDIEAATNQACASIVPHASVSGEFLFHFLASRYESIRNASNSGGQENLSSSIVKSIGVCVPEIGEQQAIADVLSDVDFLLASLDELVAKKRDLKQAAMQQLLTGRTRLPGFAGEWRSMKLGDLATFSKGRGLPKSAIRLDGSEPCIHYGELFTQYRETIDLVLGRTNQSADTVLSIAHDVLMPTSDVTPRGLAKASCILSDGVVLGGDILIIRPKPRVLHGPFLSHLVRYDAEQILQLVTGSTVFHIYASDMKNFQFSCPSVEEQAAIVGVLADMGAQVASLEARRDKTLALKQAMMQQLLTGRIRLI